MTEIPKVGIYVKEGNVIRSQFEMEADAYPIEMNTQSKGFHLRDRRWIVLLRFNHRHTVY